MNQDELRRKCEDEASGLLKCRVCGGDGFTVESRTGMGHGCDGTDEMCQRVCPIPIQEQIQVQCPNCYQGKITQNQEDVEKAITEALLQREMVIESWKKRERGSIEAITSLQEKLAEKDKELEEIKKSKKVVWDGYQKSQEKLAVARLSLKMFAECHQHDFQSCPCHIQAEQALQQIGEV